MRTLISLFLVLPCVAYAVNAFAADEQGKPKEMKSLKVGDPAPDFELKGTDGKTYQLSKFKGKSAVVIAWYPMALTGG